MKQFYTLMLISILTTFSCSSEEKGCFSYSENGVIIFENCTGDTKHIIAEDQSRSSVLDNGKEKITIAWENELNPKASIDKEGRMQIPSTLSSFTSDMSYNSGFLEFISLDSDVYKIEYWDLPTEDLSK